MGRRPGESDAAFRGRDPLAYNLSHRVPGYLSSARYTLPVGGGLGGAFSSSSTSAGARASTEGLGAVVGSAVSLMGNVGLSLVAAAAVCGLLRLLASDAPQSNPEG